MKNLNDLTIDELRKIVSEVIDSITNDSEDLAELATNIGLVLIDYELIK